MLPYSPWTSSVYFRSICAIYRWADKYKGKIDDGWDAYRERVFKRAKEKGWIPADARLTSRHETMPSWDVGATDRLHLHHWQHFHLDQSPRLHPVQFISQTSGSFYFRHDKHTTIGSFSEPFAVTVKAGRTAEFHPKRSSDRPDGLYERPAARNATARVRRSRGTDAAATTEPIPKNAPCASDVMTRARRRSV
jgi:hypothetical protein